MKKFLKIVVIILLALSLNSLIPVMGLYLKKHTRQPSNSESIEKLRGNKGDYFAFMVFGDNHAGFIFDDSATLKIVRLMNREDRFKKIPFDFVMNLGDVTFSKGRESDYKIYDKIRSMVKWPVISVMGNHDYQKGGWRHFKNYIGIHEFGFADRNSYFIGLDNKIADINAEQFRWLEMELEKASLYKHRFVFMHKSPISLYQQSWFRPELSQWSYRAMKLFERYKVDMVFAGHEHMFREATFGGVRYITSGGGGMLTQIPDSDGGYHHYVVVRVYGDYLDYEFRRVFPPFWEYITYYMWKEILYFVKGIVLKDGIF